MNSENARTSMGKWSVALTLMPLLAVALLLSFIIIPVWLGRVSGEGGLCSLIAIGEIIHYGSHVVFITSIVGIGLAILAIYKTSWKQGLPGLLLSTVTLVIPGLYLLNFYYKAAITPDRLPIAAFHDDKKAVEKLLAKGFDVNHKCGSTALCYAAVHGNEEIVKILLDHGANVSIEDPIGGAVKYGYEGVVRLLLDHGADPNRVNDAIVSRHPQIAKILLDHGASVNVKIDNSGRTLLQSAVEWGQEEIVKLLITKGVDVNARNNAGETPLHVLAQIRPQDCWTKDFRAKVIRILLDSGADINAKDKKGRTALQCVMQAKNTEMIKLLLDNDADANTVDDKGVNVKEYLNQN